MIRAAVPFVFAILFCGTSLADPVAMPQMCTLNKLASLDLAMEPTGILGVPLTIDSQPVRFTIDTGALMSIVSDSIVDELKLDRKTIPIEFTLPGGVKTHTEATTHTFTIGGLTAHGFGLAVMPASAFVDFESDGLLGPDILSNYDVDFDFAHAKFNLFSQDHCEGKVVYWAKDGAFARIPFSFVDHLHIAAPVVLDGKDVTAVIDTGAEQTMMSLSTARTLGIDVTAANVTKEKGSINGTAEAMIYHYPFSSLSLQGITISHPDIAIIPDFNLTGAQIVLGVETLRRLHLYIAYKEKALYVTPAETP